MQVVRDFDPAHVALFADAGHLSICGEPIDMALDIMRSHLRVCAFKDLVHTTVQRNGRAMPATRCVRMGEGLVDWQTTVEALEAMDSPVRSAPQRIRPRTGPTVIDLAACDVRFHQRLAGRN